MKKRSCGPTIGTPSALSLDLFYLCSYDVDGRRAFVKSPGFNKVFALQRALIDTLLEDEPNVVKFRFRLLKRVHLGEQTIAHRKEAAERVTGRLAANDGAIPGQPASQ